MDPEAAIGALVGSMSVAGSAVGLLIFTVRQLVGILDRYREDNNDLRLRILALESELEEYRHGIHTTHAAIDPHR